MLKRILSLLLFLLSFVPMQAQCEKQNSACLNLVLESMPDAKIANQIRITLKNDTTEKAFFVGMI